MRVIMIERQDGGVSLLRTELGPEHDAAEVRKWEETAEPAISFREINEADAPTDRTFRNAWKKEAVRLQVDMAKARDLHRDRMRAARKPKLDALDVEYQRADETSDIIRKQEIAVQKQALRDVTADPRINAAVTPEDLKAVWPDILK